MTATIRCFYPSLASLPGTRVDEFGNLNVTGANEKRNGLRSRYDFAMRLPAAALAGTLLPELLNWLRWGSSDSVMWECTAEELLALIERWESGNPNAKPQAYGIIWDPAKGDRPLKWSRVWKNAYIWEAEVRRRCNKCHRLYSYDHWTMCFHRKKNKPCGGELYTEEIHGRRGLGSYNLLLVGMDGYAMAEAAYRSRGCLRAIPQLRTPPPC